MASDSGKGRARRHEALEEGIRLAKGGLPERAIAVYRDVRATASDPADRAEAWRLEAYAQQALSEWPAALEAARASRRVAEELDRPALVAEAMNAEAAVHYGRGELEEAAALFEGMLELTDDPRIRGLAHQNLGIIHGRRGDAAGAESRLLEAYDEFERAGYAWGMAHVLNNRAGLALDREEYETAERLAEEAIGSAKRVDDLDLLAVSTLNYAEALEGLGRLDEAEERASTALGYFQTAGNRWRRISCYQILGSVHQRRGDHGLARRFWEEGLGLARQLGAATETARLEACLAELTRSGDDP